MAVRTPQELARQIATLLASGSDITATELRSVATDIADTLFDVGGVDANQVRDIAGALLATLAEFTYDPATDTLTFSGGGGRDSTARAAAADARRVAGDAQTHARENAALIAAIQHLLGDLSYTPHDDWVNNARVEQGGFILQGINDGDPQSGRAVSAPANARGSSNYYTMTLYLPAGSAVADFRITVDGVPHPDHDWSQGSSQNIDGTEYDTWTNIGGIELLPRGGTVRIQRSTRAYQTTYDGDLSPAARNRALGIPAGAGFYLAQRNDDGSITWRVVTLRAPDPGGALTLADLGLTLGGEEVLI